MPQEYYGDRHKWFVGIVKSIDDPKASNRVKVYIPGVHPPVDNSTAVSQPTGSLSSPSSSTSTSSTTPNSTQPAYTGNASQPAVPHSSSTVDLNSLPAASNLNAQLSTHYRLRDLALAGGSGHENMRAIQAGVLTQHIIANLKTVATDLLEPLLSAGYHINLMSGWRAAGFSHVKDRGNHSRGVAADIVTGSQATMKAQMYPIARVLYGRFSFLYYENDHIHVQFGSEGGAMNHTCSNQNPFIWVNTAHPIPYRGE